MNDYPDFPTVLIVHEDRVFQEALSLRLQNEGYIVLPASDANDAIQIVRTHSRRIDLLITDESASSQTTAAALKEYRRHIEILLLSPSVEVPAGNPIGLDLALEKVREFLAPLEKAQKRSINRSTKSATAG